MNSILGSNHVNFNLENFKLELTDLEYQEMYELYEEDIKIIISEIGCTQKEAVDHILRHGNLRNVLLYLLPANSKYIIENVIIPLTVQYNTTLEVITNLLLIKTTD